MRSINVNIHPHDGHYFKDSDGVRHFADTWAGVVARVKAYRRRKGAPPGDPESEVIAQACARNPVLCSESDGRRELQLKKTSLKTKLINWLNAVRGNQTKRFVEEPLARKRADICASCDRNTPLQDGCASCRAALTELRRQVLGNRFLDGRLNGCIVMGEDLPTAVHIDLDAVENAELPAHCWRRRQL
jgi:hypothetical protein